jgi:hypothetical protein
MSTGSGEQHHEQDTADGRRVGCNSPGRQGQPSIPKKQGAQSSILSLLVRHARRTFALESVLPAPPVLQRGVRPQWFIHGGRRPCLLTPMSKLPPSGDRGLTFPSFSLLRRLP